ncbi:MAG: hypothetical protein F6K65_18320 [Moorea sp. SIO3C2]|nr:hypothetical protein [Moorena sp. SIO3C2]
MALGFTATGHQVVYLRVNHVHVGWAVSSTAHPSINLAERKAEGIRQKAEGKSQKPEARSQKPEARVHVGWAVQTQGYCQLI